MSELSLTQRRIGRWTLGPAMRVGFGLSTVVVALLLMVNMAFEVLPNHQEMLSKLRGRIAENVSMQAAPLIDAGDRAGLDRVCANLLAREASVQSIAVRRSDGSILAQAGDHASWSDPGSHASALDHVRVPLVRQGTEWGAVEIRFQTARPLGLLNWLFQPATIVVLALGLTSFAVFALYLRRVLSYLDPSTVIPERVRTAFDAFASGVMIVDNSSRMMLANATLRQWIGVAEGSDVIGRPVESLPGFSAALGENRNEHCWVRSMHTRAPTQGEHLVLHQETGSALRLLVNSSPITDGGGRVRGCLVTLDNVTHLHELNENFLKSMLELAESKRALEQTNQELHRLATRDPLTGCLNRRELFERMDDLFFDARSRGRALCCIMTDIDHFKTFNDRHGHAVGDEVLKVVANVFTVALRDFDLVGRYGGEEFCIVLPDVDLDQACIIAERLRSQIEATAGNSVRTTRGLKITASFGVSAHAPDIVDPAQMIDFADKALYVAKKSGRNRVQRAGDPMPDEAVATGARPEKTLTIVR